jgi:Icc-related predicted phosphoesterase
MKIWHLGDTHTYHNLLEIPEGIDMVIFSGDCSNPRAPYTNEPEVRDFIDWFGKLPIKHKVFVAGNHDSSIESKLVIEADFNDNGIIYLENNSITIEGIKIFGSPLTPQFGQWSFMKARNKLDRIWPSIIEDDVDVVVTHGPPKGILDIAEDRNHNIEFCGDRSLMNRIREINPKLSLFGHIHNNSGIKNAGARTVAGMQTVFSNGSVVTDRKFGTLSSNGNIFEL